MGRKSSATNSSEEVKRVEEKYRVINLIEAIQSVPYYDETGNVAYLNLRIQNKGGQQPPVILSTAITTAMLNFQKKKLIKLEKISD